MVVQVNRTMADVRSEPFPPMSIVVLNTTTFDQYCLPTRHTPNVNLSGKSPTYRMDKYVLFYTDICRHVQLVCCKLYIYTVLFLKNGFMFALYRYVRKLFLYTNERFLIGSTRNNPRKGTPGPPQICRYLCSLDYPGAVRWQHF